MKMLMCPKSFLVSFLQNVKKQLWPAAAAPWPFGLVASLSGSPQKESETSRKWFFLLLSLATLCGLILCCFFSFLSCLLPFPALQFFKGSLQANVALCESRLTVSKFLLSRLLAFYLWDHTLQRVKINGAPSKSAQTLGASRWPYTRIAQHSSHPALNEISADNFLQDFCLKKRQRYQTQKFCNCEVHTRHNAEERCIISTTPGKWPRNYSTHPFCKEPTKNG